jgi:hypothetical protein
MYFRFYTPLANNLEAHYIHAHISLILVPDVNMIGHPVLSNSFSYFFYCKILHHILYTRYSKSLNRGRIDKGDDPDRSIMINTILLLVNKYTIN